MGEPWDYQEGAGSIPARYTLLGDKHIWYVRLPVKQMVVGSNPTLPANLVPSFIWLGCLPVTERNWVRFPVGPPELTRGSYLGRQLDTFRQMWHKQAGQSCRWIWPIRSMSVLTVVTLGFP